MDKVFQNVTNIRKLAQKNKPFNFYITTYREPFNHPQKCLKEGFCNFDFISHGQHVGTDEKGKPILSPKSGVILFPKYPALNEKGEPVMPLPGELFVIAEKLKGHPLNWS